jgi:hypothetical protein
VDWWQILLAGVPSLFSGILLYEWEQQRKRIKEQENEKEVRNEALVKGVQYAAIQGSLPYQGQF